MAIDRLAWSQASAAKTVTFSSGDISGAYDALQLLLNVTAATGTTPSMTITLEGKDEAGAYFTLATLTAITAAGKTIAHFGAGLPNNIIIPKTFRLTFTITGTTPSFTFTAFLYGV